MALLYDELERLVVAAQRCKGKLESLDEKPNLQNEIGRLLEMLYAELGLLEVNVVYLSGDPVTKPVLLHPEEKLGSKQEHAPRHITHSPTATASPSLSPPLA